MASHLIFTIFVVHLHLLQLVSSETTCAQPPVNPGSRKADVDQIKLDRATFQNCTIVHGNLMISNYRLNESHFDFLSKIREVTGFVVFQNNIKISRIPLPNLVLIRGERRYDPFVNSTLKPCALCSIGNTELLSIGLARLVDIRNGAVTITNSPRLCYARLVNWTDVLAAGFELQTDSQVGTDAQCRDARCDSRCPYSNCFGGSLDECHNLTRLVCRGCDDRCVGPTQADCCNRQCVGGCRAPGASDQCFACGNVNNDGHCVDRCPESTVFNAILGHNEPNPNGKVRLRNQCRLRCPSYMAIDGDACVTVCSRGKTEVNGVCEKCPSAGSCPVYCDGNGAQPEIVRAGSAGVADFIDARNVHRFYNCTHINFNLRIMQSTFYSKANPNGLLVDDLKNALRHVKVVTGYVEISLSNILELQSFDFLENLEIIHGRFLVEDRDALFIGVIAKQKLNYLGLRSLKSISNGNVRLLQQAACAGNAVTAVGWSRLLANSSIQKYEAQPCANSKLSPVCSDGCNATLGCWGPTDNMCIECRHFRLRDRCMLQCTEDTNQFADDDVPLYYGNTTTRTCEPCHSQCADGCYGPRSSDCFRCRSAVHRSACVAKCPPLYWMADNRSCLPCHDNCEAGCSGPSNRLGDDGCYQCYRTVQPEHSSQDKYCASKTDKCEPGYYAMRTSGVNGAQHLRTGGDAAASISGQRLMCVLCPPGCFNCSDGPPTRCNVCRFARIETQPSVELLEQTQAQDAYWNWIAQLRDSDFLPTWSDASVNTSNDWHSVTSVNNDTQSNLASLYATASSAAPFSSSSASSASGSARLAALLRTNPKINFPQTISEELASNSQNSVTQSDESTLTLSGANVFKEASQTGLNSPLLRGTDCVTSFACPPNFFMHRAPILQNCIDKALQLEAEAASAKNNASEDDIIDRNSTLNYPSRSFVNNSDVPDVTDRLAKLPECRQGDNLCLPCDPLCKSGCDGLGAHRCIDCVFARVDLDEFADDTMLNRTDRPLFQCVNECPLSKPHRQQRNVSRLLSSGELVFVKVAVCSHLESVLELTTSNNRLDSQRLLILAAVIFLSLCTIAFTIMYVSYSMRRRARHKFRTARITAELTGLNTREGLDEVFEDDGDHKMHKCKSGSVKSKSTLDMKDSFCRTMNPRSPVGPAPDMAKLNLIRTNELLRGSPIGSGAFGTVYRGLWVPISPNGENIKIKIPVAIKVLNEPTAREKMDFLEEARVMSSVNHYCCVRVMAVCMAQQMQLVSELLPLGSLLEYIRTHRDDTGSKHMLTWATQIAMGMAYLEERKIVHRDLAARNVLVQSSKQVKITDFGLAKLLDADESDYVAEGGKLPIKWLALESILHRIFNHKTDVWSFGVTMWEILTYGARPYGNIHAIELSILLEKGERLPQPEICTIDTYMVMVKCWMLDCSCRPSFTELVDELARMCHDPGRYLMIPGDELMRLPGTVDYTRDEVILNTLNELNIEAIADFRVVPAEEYLRPGLRHPTGSVPTSSPSAHSVGVAFVVENTAHSTTTTEDVSRATSNAATNWCYELAGTRGDVVDGPVPSRNAEVAPLEPKSSTASQCTVTTSKQSPKKVMSTALGSAASEGPALRPRARLDAESVVPKRGANTTGRPALRHSQSTESCPLPSNIGGSLSRFSALELEKERRRRDKTQIGDRAIQRASEMRATRYSLDPIEVRRQSALLDHDEHARNALLPNDNVLQPRACSSVRTIDTYVALQFADGYVPMGDAHVAVARSASERVPQPISVRVRSGGKKRLSSHPRRRADDDADSCEFDADNYDDRIVDENEEDESALVSPTMLSPVFSVSTPPSSAHTAHNPEYFDGTEQTAESPFDKTPRSHADSELATCNKSYFLLPADDVLSNAATELIERGQRSSTSTRTKSATPFSLTAC